jgi:hypothetical protein
MAIELAQRGVLRGRLRFPRGFALELFGVLPGADLPSGLRRGRESASGNLAMASSSAPESSDVPASWATSLISAPRLASRAMVERPLPVFAAVSSTKAFKFSE